MAADAFSDLYPIPVEFTDGQQPTAAFLNAWAEQIDLAFVLLSQMVGDFDGTGDAADTYSTNILRAIGVMGWINTRLPADLSIPTPTGGGAGGTLPFITEELDSAFTGEKLAELTFLPYWIEATNAEITAAGPSLTTAKAGGVIQRSTTLTAAGDWVLDGKKVMSATAIAAGDMVSYPIDPTSDLWKDSYGSSTGANLVPSIYEIGSTLVNLCTLDRPGGYGLQERRISFPEVRRIMNPAKPFSIVETDTINLDNPIGAPSPVYWDTTGGRTAPLYRIPQYIVDIASAAALRIPNGMASLWLQTGGAITRIRPAASLGDIQFDLLPGEPHAVRITFPVGYTIPALGDNDGVNPAGADYQRWIVAFAGTSVAEALNHERARSLHHGHDGQDGSLVSAQHLKDAFDPGDFFHSQTPYHPFPQYLGRAGYDSGDVLNRLNSMLGDLHISHVNATPSAVGIDPDNVTVNSWKLTFGDHALGPRIWFNFGDVSGAHNVGKLQLDQYPLRILSDLYLGDTANTMRLTAYRTDLGGGAMRTIISAQPDPIGLDPALSIVSSHMLRARGARIYFGSTVPEADTVVGWTDAILNVTSGVDTEYIFNGHTGAATTRVVVAEVSANSYSLQAPSDFKIHIGPEDMTVSTYKNMIDLTASYNFGGGGTGATLGSTPAADSNIDSVIPRQDWYLESPIDAGGDRHGVATNPTGGSKSNALDDGAGTTGSPQIRIIAPVRFPSINSPIQAASGLRIKSMHYRVSGTEDPSAFNIQMGRRPGADLDPVANPGTLPIAGFTSAAIPGVAADPDNIVYTTIDPADHTVDHDYQYYVAVTIDMTNAGLLGSPFLLEGITLVCEADNI
jgi:hypothetical protein